MKTKFNPWPYGIVFAFVVFISGMAAFVVVASRQQDSLVEKNYYESELKFQDQINNAARAQAVGATILRPAEGRLVIQLPVAQLAQNISGTVELYRPSSAKLDQSIALKPDATGAQTVDVSKLVPGAWAVRVKWNACGENYFLEQKIKI